MSRGTQYASRTRLALVALLVAGCSSEPLGGSGEGDGGRSVDAGTPVTDAAPSPDATAPSDGGIASPLSLTLEVADGECTDLARTDRAAPAVRFVATGRPDTTVELWADKPGCDGEAFRYQTLLLDAAGEGGFDLAHGGSTAGCSDNLLGTWGVWLVDGTRTTPRQELTFRSTGCAEASSCAAADGFCPAPEEPSGPLIPKDEVFVLSAYERERFTPPDPGWATFGSGYESYPLEQLWHAFDEGRAPVPMDETVDPGWTSPDGGGSRNHGPLWMGESALGHAFQENPARFDAAAEKCIQILELDDLQGHMRDEAVGGYASFWAGGVASMALAGHYAPAGSTMGPALLAKAREWWRAHIVVMRNLSMPDGQVGLLGARIGGASGDTDSWTSLSAAVTKQIVDPIPHDRLHPNLAALVRADGQPGPGTGGIPVRWYRGRSSWRWVVLRAARSGAIVDPPLAHPTPPLAQDIYRWSEGARIYLATPEVRGLRPARWKVSWAPGTVVRIEVGETAEMVPSGTGRGPHPSPEPLGIPAGLSFVLGGL